MDPTESTQLLKKGAIGSTCSGGNKSENGRNRLITVEPIIVVYHMVMLSAQPILQQYVYRVLADQYNVNESLNGSDLCVADDSTLEDDAALNRLSEDAAVWNIAILFSNLMPSFFTTVLLGSYGDRLGRRKMIIPPIAGCLISSVLLIVYMRYDWPLFVIVVIVIITGMSGGIGTINLGCFAYMCDISTKEQRFHKMFVVELCTGLGTLIAQISTGYLIEYLGFMYPVIVQASLLLCIFVYAVFFLDESAPKALPKGVACPNWYAIISFYIKDNGTGRRLVLQLTFLLLVSIVFLEEGISNILTFYLLDPPFCWGPELIGIFSGTAFMVKTLGGLALTALLVGRLKETTIIYIGCLSYIGVFLCLAFAKGSPLAFTGAVCGFATYMGLPMVRAISSKHVNPHELGALFAGLSSAHTLLTVLGTMALNPLYAWSAVRWHGLVCIVAASGMIIPVLLNTALKIHLSKKSLEHPGEKHDIISPE